MRLKPKARTPVIPPTSQAPGRTLVFTSSSHHAIEDDDELNTDISSVVQHDFFYNAPGPEYTESITSTVAEQSFDLEQYIMMHYSTPDDTWVSSIEEEPEVTSTTVLDDSELSPEDELFDDLPEDPCSPIHELAPHWPFRGDDDSVTAISITPVGRPKIVEITLSAMAKKRRQSMSPRSSPRPEKRWAHSRNSSGASDVTVSPSLSVRSKSEHGDGQGSLGPSTPATSVADESRSRSPSVYETPIETLSPKEMTGAAPEIPRRSHYRTVSRTVSKATLDEEEQVAESYPSPPSTPLHDTVEVPPPLNTKRPTIERRTVAQANARPSHTKSNSSQSFSRRKKSITSVLMMSQNVLT